MNDADFDDRSESFMQWLSSQSDVIISPKIALHDYTDQNGGRGLIATEDITANEVLFSIPRSTLLSWQNSTLKDKLELQAEKVEELGDWNMLILTLLYENSRPESTWTEYLQILPRDFCTPMFWDAEEISELQGSNLCEKIGRQEADQAYHDLIHPIISSRADLFDITKCGLDQFHRMGSLIMAYSFDAPLDMHDDTKDNENSLLDSDDEEDGEEEEEEKFEKVMCPLADLLNADTEFNNARLYYRPDALEMKSIKSISKNEQIYNTYGDLPNSDLLRRYGYVQQMNPHDVVEVPGDAITALFPLSEAEKEDRVDWLLDMEILDDAFEISRSGKVPTQVLVTIDVLSLDAPAWKQVKNQERDVPKGKKTSTMKTLVRTILKSQLDKYSTSLADDEKALQQSEVPYNKRNAITVRLGEKTILTKALEVVEAWEVDDPSSRKRGNDAARDQGNKKNRAK